MATIRTSFGGRGLVRAVIWKKLRRRLRADAEKGSAAIEFAIVAPIFFTLLLGTFEAGIMFFSQSVLQNAVTDAGRLVRTGQAACFNKNPNGSCASAMTEQQFVNQICDTAGILLMNCSSALKLDVDVATNGFSALSTPLIPNPSNPGDLSQQLFNPAFPLNFNLGNACDVVVVRAFYQWSVVTPVLSWFLVNMSGGQHLLSAASAFRNEPFTADVAGC